MQTTVADDGHGDGHVQGDAEDAANEFQENQDSVSDVDRVVDLAVNVEHNVVGIGKTAVVHVCQIQTLITLHI